MVVLLVLTVTLGAFVATAVDADLTAGPPTTRLSLDADAGTNRVMLVHRTGDTLDVHELSMRVEIEGEELAHQPPIPFFAAEGFRGGPHGVFNRASNGLWTAGELASVQVASTNTPELESGDLVRVTLRTDRGLVQQLSAQAS